MAKEYSGGGGGGWDEWAGCEILNVKFTFSNKTFTIVITHNFSGSISHRLIHQANGSEQCHTDGQL